MRHSVRRRVIPIVAALVLLPAGQQLANAAPNDPAPAVPNVQSTDNLDPHTLAVMRQQEALEPAVALLYGEMLNSSSSGFASIAFEGDGVSLYWKGDLPSGMARVVAAARQLAPVRVRPAQYSKAELEAAAARIEAAAAGGDIQEITLKYDGSGIELVKMPPSLADLVRARAATLGRQSPTAEQALSRLNLDVPVAISTADGPNGFASCAGTCNRLDDTSPWNGGTYLKIPNTPTGTIHCTSGFGMRNSSGTTYLLTAAHCSTTQPFYDYAGEYIGGVYRESWRYDVLLVNARGMYWIFDGSPTTSFHKTVHIYGYPVVNQLLCQSGSTSGTVCGLMTVSGVYSFGLCDSDGDCFTVYDVNKAYQVDGKTAIRKGDSGGPVFSLYGDGVQAKGIVNGYCGSYGSNCMYFQDFATISNLFGVYPRTG